MKNHFPGSSAYDAEWARKFSIGSNVLYSTEVLLDRLPNKKIKRVLDMGSGYALSSILLSKELDCEVWAVDKYIGNRKVLAQLKKTKTTKVFPYQLSVNSLPFPSRYFDAIVCINSYSYFGTDDKFLPCITQFLKPGGLFAITDICVSRERNSVKEVPSLLKKDFFYYWQHIHSLEWWKNKWEKSGLLRILQSGHSEKASLLKKEYLEIAKLKEWDAFSKVIKKDRKNIVDYFYLIAEKNELVPFLEKY